MTNGALRATFVLVASLMLAVATTVSALAQEKKLSQTAGVDDTPMGAYRALAQLSLQAFEKGDIATAAELARILERTWDKGEESGGDQSLVKKDKGLFEKADKAMDAFIKPIIHIRYGQTAPTDDSVKGAYKAFLEKLKEADNQRK